MAAIRKVFVSTGTYFVDIPDAGVHILCGCPSDTVKSLIKRGVIVSVEEGGVQFETGPNVILLSDKALQGGRFANLGEFPVLQMLYRQGLILPGHPNNTGSRPLIMGAEHQVKAQLDYIYRGNYGLISEQEMIDCGIDAEEAKQLMRIELKFAFGRIAPADELLDTRIIDDQETDVRNGVTIQRLAMNVFQISFEGESIEVDLNLEAHENYSPPYTLGMHDIERGYFSVIHSGDGDGWDVNRPSMSTVFMFQGRIYLVDAGPNVINSLHALGIGVNEIEGVFHTHSHDDHFCGLNSIIQADHRIKYFATPLVRSCVTKKLTALLGVGEEDFEKYFDIHDLVLDDWNAIDGLEVKPLLSPHPVETTIFIFRTMWENGYKTYGHFADIVSRKVLQNMIVEDQETPGISQVDFDKTWENYLTPVDLKRIDIGGGLIHGMAEDFSDDRSGKIVLSHTALKLTDAQKEIGSGAAFGTVETLIPNYQNYSRRDAFVYLKAYFPSVAEDQLRILLNSPVQRFNPETIIIREGEESEFVNLILTGNVEMIQSDEKIHSSLSSGALLGEDTALHGLPSLQTYRASNFVWCLRIPRSLYLAFVANNNLFGEISHLQERREFLQRVTLFEEAISYGVLNRIAAVSEICFHEAGTQAEFPADNALLVVESGEVLRIDASGVETTFKAGSFFGEEKLFGEDISSQLKFTEPTHILSLPLDIIGEIPIIRWKLFENLTGQVA
ncbi:MAG: cyclic nucleotide-binding domain-containing protein [Alphaproteobacteria bacterium]|jgi:hemerythrin|nr:cyclic nucleotide-binding domain-containing protein [Alphaproteobacteria bacterium]MBT4084205.1 cyclic nucleotide-binding domain-containing protein [Alphaproteobacteria bacterium]MBT4544102.1 cyclic nucleotide-binding domain-containing protein [Alphaproteobacteria bacterium]MBT7746071.1 cyclic nucleotide-binding domain-containing protein [Alphaproteobacteria bacterium]